MPIADTGRKAEANGSGISTVTINLNSTVAGNTILVAVTSDGTTRTVSDNVNGAYSNAYLFSGTSSRDLVQDEYRWWQCHNHSYTIRRWDLGMVRSPSFLVSIQRRH